MKRIINVSIDIGLNESEETELEACNRVADLLVEALEPYVPVSIADLGLEVIWVYDNNYDGEKESDEGHEPVQPVTRG